MSRQKRTLQMFTHISKLVNINCIKLEEKNISPTLLVR